MRYKNAVIITGPTTTGKTEVAIGIARRLDGELINSDKLYFYSYFRIGTGLYDHSESPDVPHHLYAILKPEDEELGVERYVKEVENIIPKILHRDRLPIIEGCSPSYNSTLIECNKEERRNFYYYPVIGLRWPKGIDLMNKLKKRLDQMFDKHLLEETDLALKNGLRNTYVIKDSFVYGPIVKYLEGYLTLEQTKEEILDRALCVAKTQLEKFEKIPEIIWIEYDSNKPNEAIESIIKMINIYNS